VATLEELVVQLTAETSGLRAELNGAAKATQQATEKMDAAVKSFSDNSSKNTNFFQTAMATATGFLGSQAVLGAFSLVKDAASAMADALIEGGQAAIAEEQALTRLNNSLALSGNFSAEAARGLQTFAGEMEELTNVGDDVVLSNLAVLSSITKLDAEGLKVAQKSALDMAAALGIDLDSATRLVAKGIEGNTEAFKRYGITIEKGRNDTENFTNVVNALSNQFGGAAAGSIKNFGGAVTSLSNSFGNFTEELAKSVTQNPVVIAMLSKITEIFKNLTSETSGVATSLKEDVASAFTTLINVVTGAIVAVDTFVRLVKGGLLAILTPIIAVQEGLNAITSLLTGEIPTDPFAQTKGAFEDLTNVLDEETTLGNLATKLQEVSLAGENAFGKIADSANIATPAIENHATKVKELTELEKARLEAVNSFAQGLADQSVSVDAAYKMQSEQLKLNLETGLISQQEYFEQLNTIRAEQDAVEQQALLDSYAAKGVTDAEYLAAKTQLQLQQANEKVKIDADQKKKEDEFNKQRLENMKSTLGTISSLQSSSSKELAAIGKAAAVSQATIDGYAAVQKALASAPPPFNFALAALVGAATAANVAKIAGVGLQSGITNVPKNASGGNFGDNFPAVLSPGERVVDSQTNQDLKAFLANQNGGGANINLNITVAPGTGITREQTANLIEAFNDYLSAGGIKLVGMQ